MLLDQGHGSRLHVSPGFVQVPQLGLQQIWPALQVFMPQVTLTGTYMPAQGSLEQVPPDGTQMPQLALQQISDTLQVFGPHGTLTGAAGAPQKSGHVSPGETQVLQFQLQHCCPLSHVRHPHRTGAGGSDLTGP
ncbi:MAG TPA: hypothetical protein VK550_34495 [Polyangiaceae bacterium]|nr:hypothetical protein [Polyangiaceae bacterium]